MTAREALERFECREQCAERGEPPCFELDKFAGAAFVTCELCARMTTARIAALRAAGYELVRAHRWHRPEGINLDYDCCKDCGIVRRADDRNRPCLGPVRVGVRLDKPLKDEYTEGSPAMLSAAKEPSHDA